MHIIQTCYSLGFAIFVGGFTQTCGVRADFEGKVGQLKTQRYSEFHGFIPLYTHT